MQYLHGEAGRRGHPDGHPFAAHEPQRGRSRRVLERNRGDRRTDLERAGRSDQGGRRCQSSALQLPAQPMASAPAGSGSSGPGTAVVRRPARRSALRGSRAPSAAGASPAVDRPPRAARARTRGSSSMRGRVCIPRPPPPPAPASSGRRRARWPRPGRRSGTPPCAASRLGLPGSSRPSGPGRGRSPGRRPRRRADRGGCPGRRPGPSARAARPGPRRPPRRAGHEPTEQLPVRQPADRPALKTSRS